MLLPKMCAAMLMLAALTACATPATRTIADSACLSFSVIGYAIPPMQGDGTRNMAEDPGNKYDTTETVASVQEHNARWRAVCPERGR